MSKIIPELIAMEDIVIEDFEKRLGYPSDFTEKMKESHRIAIRWGFNKGIQTMLDIVEGKIKVK